LFLPKNQAKQMPYRSKTAFFLKFNKKSSRRRNKLAEFAGIITILYQQYHKLSVKFSHISQITSI